MRSFSLDPTSYKMEQKKLNEKKTPIIINIIKRAPNLIVGCPVWGNRIALPSLGSCNTLTELN